MLTIRPITLRDANAYVAAHHRHNQPTTGHKWSLALYDDDRLCGVAIAGQPIARKLDDGLTHSEASDWAKRWKACGLFNKETNHENVIRLVGAERGQTTEPLEGQIGLEMTNNG